MDRTESLEERIRTLDRAVREVGIFYRLDPPLAAVVYETWSVKDVLGHLVMWHRSFADNLQAVALGRRPSPLRGTLAEVNERGVAEARGRTVAQLLDDLDRAQAVVAAHIAAPGLGLIPYKSGSRPYTPEEHLEVVARHIGGHLRDLEKAVRR